MKTFETKSTKKKELVATARYGKKEHGRDKILNRIKSMKKYYINLESIFRNQDTTTIIKNWSTDGATLVGKAVQS